MRRWLLIISLLPAAARADDLSADAIVKRARAVMERKPAHATCKVEVETEVLDKHGAIEHRDQREGEITIDGEEQDFKATRGWRDGKEVSAHDLAEERDKARKQHAANKGKEQDLLPLASKNASGQSFTLLRREPLWGHDAYVLQVSALQPSPNLANGTLWIDAERFVELKGELEPAKLPDHADWLKVQEQFSLGNRDAPLPTLQRIEGAGHYMFLHKGFRSTLKWIDCH
jgi:hypothetical protein